MNLTFWIGFMTGALCGAMGLVVVALWIANR
jgi:hypothetical protein